MFQGKPRQGASPPSSGTSTERGFLVFQHTGEVIQAERALREAGFAVEVKGPPPELLAFPQLLLSPVLHGVLWQGMFRDMESLDMEAMYRAYLDMILPEKD